MMDTTDTERSPTIRLTAAERRDAIVDAAMHEFALGGFGGTPGAATAPCGGVSQPYPFALFRTNRNRFITAVKRGFEQRSVLTDQAKPSVAAAIDLPEAGS